MLCSESLVVASAVLLSGVCLKYEQGVQRKLAQIQRQRRLVSPSVILMHHHSTAHQGPFQPLAALNSRASFGKRQHFATKCYGSAKREPRLLKNGVSLRALISQFQAAAIHLKSKVAALPPLLLDSSVSGIAAAWNVPEYVF